MLAIQREVIGELIDRHAGQQADIGDALTQHAGRRRGTGQRTVLLLDQRSNEFQHDEAGGPLSKSQRHFLPNDLCIGVATRSRKQNLLYGDRVIEAQFIVGLFGTSRTSAALVLANGDFAGLDVFLTPLTQFELTSIGTKHTTLGFRAEQLLL